jgi:hypothetical protein
MTDDEDLRQRTDDVVASIHVLIGSIRRLRAIDAQRALVPAHYLADSLQDVTTAVLALRREILIQIREETALSLSALGQRISLTRGRVDQIIKTPIKRARRYPGRTLMANDMAVHVEVWPLAADEAGIWLLSGAEAWMLGRAGMPVQTDSDPHGDAEQILAVRGARRKGDVRFLHSTSWRVDLPRLIVTYIAALTRGLRCGPTGRRRCPYRWSSPTGSGRCRMGLRSAPGVADDAVLLHGIRHIAFLLETDPRATESLDDTWRAHLAGLAPALAGLYTAA